MAPGSGEAAEKLALSASAISLNPETPIGGK
jgi:hypothetical protein